MKAIICTEYGPPEVLRLGEVVKPTPGSHEVLVRVNAASVNYGDLAARNFQDITPRRFNMPFLFWVMAKLFFGLGKPKIKILGSEFAGIVEATGEGVTKFVKGDPVFGYLGQRMGAYAEYLCVPENGVLASKPANMTDEEAAVVPYGSIMALHLLRKVNMRSGQKVLINGASGGIGSAAVQLAKYYGAEVTGVCGAPGLEFVKSLGADKVIDYTREDFTQNGETYDLIFDILGKTPFSRSKSSLSPNGCHLFASFKMKQIIQMLWTSMTARTRGGKRVICAIAPGGIKDLISVKELIEAGKIKSVIDRCYPLEQIAEAHRYVETGLKKGKVVIAVRR